MTSSTIQDRSATRLMAVVAELAVQFNPRYVRRDVDGDGKVETFCNFFAADFTSLMDVAIPLVKANEQADWLRSSTAKLRGWEEVPEHVAQSMAAEGLPVLATWKNPSGGHGHIAAVVPALGEAGTWIAQAGAANFARGKVTRGFGVYPVTYFGHP